jgi:hypothetical protein
VVALANFDGCREYSEDLSDQASVSTVKPTPRETSMLRKPSNPVPVGFADCISRGCDRSRRAISTQASEGELVSSGTSSSSRSGSSNSIS